MNSAASKPFPMPHGGMDVRLKPVEPGNDILKKLLVKAMLDSRFRWGLGKSTDDRSEVGSSGVHV